MKKEILYNKKSREILLKELQEESFNRITCSFYRYTTIKDLEQFRDILYKEWSTLKICGRIYITEEGINGQFSCPQQNWESFKNNLQSHNALKGMQIKIALEEGESFYKLTIKIKDEIVAYGIDKNEYDMGITGDHLSAKLFNEKLNDENSVVVDMRNYYESEVGHFENAIVPDADTSRDLLPEVKKLLKD